MGEDKVEASISELKTAARELLDGFGRANRLPDGFPIDYMKEVLFQVDAIEDKNEDSVRIAMHLRDKILQIVESYKSESEFDGPSFLKALHNDLFVKVSIFLNISNSASLLQELLENKGRTFIDAFDNEEMCRRISSEVKRAIEDAKRAEANVANFIQQNGLVNIGNLNIDIEATLIKARKAMTSVLIEIESKIIDVAWLSEFMKLLGRYSISISDAIKSAGNALRSSKLVVTIQEFLNKTSKLMEDISVLVRRALPVAKTKAGIASKSEDVEYTAVAVGQAYRESGIYINSVRWEVASLVPKHNGYEEVMHARLINKSGRLGISEKTIAVSVLRDKRRFDRIE